MAILALTTGTILLMWIGEQITEHGVGNGISILIFASILTGLPLGITAWWNGGPMERIFASGMREFLKLRERRVNDAGALLDGARRAMRASFQREMDAIESHLSFLASVGSVSPYVGLFGTVWGIMHAIVGLSNLQQVTLATVAPGIAEALVATAIGLFAAIPAVIAYNRFARDIDRIAIQSETFIEEFSNILHRNASQGPTSVPAATGTLGAH